MSLITACPACQTQFEVTDEQLQAYAGKVRCGECNHVFDARSYLLDAPQAEAPSDAAVYFNISAEAAQTPTDTPVADYELPASLSASLAADTQQAEPVIPAFLRNVSLTDERPVVVQKPVSQSLFGLLSALMIGLILIQWLYFSRSHLAASYPASRPMLQTLCKALQCAVALPQDITQLTIDDADIQEHKLRQGVLVFSSVLMNHGQVVQSYPMIELTLTNTADEPVLRKTLRPEQYLPVSVNVHAGLPAQQEQPVKAVLGVDEKLVTGFRVAIAY